MTATLRIGHAALIAIGGWAVLLSGAPTAARSQTPAQTVPAVIRACLAEADPGRRLDCYDREVARLIMPAERPATAPSGAAPPVPAATDQAPPPVNAASPQAAPVPRPAAAKAPTHYAAHVEHIESGGDQLVVHLDNGQIWEQLVAGDSDLSLHNGDAVSVDRQLGSWWLTDRYGGTLQVRLHK